MQWPKTGTGKAFYIALIAVVVPSTVWFLTIVPSYVVYALGARCARVGRALPLAAQARRRSREGLGR